MSDPTPSPSPTVTPPAASELPPEVQIRVGFRRSIWTGLGFGLGFWFSGLVLMSLFVAVGSAILCGSGVGLARLIWGKTEDKPGGVPNLLGLGGPRKSDADRAAEEAKRTVPAEMGKAVQLGDLEITPLDAGVGKILIGRNGDSITRDDYLWIRLKIKNLSQTKRVEYWAFRGSSDSKLTDEHGNSFKAVENFSFEDPWQFARGISEINPGAEVLDLAVFEQPLAISQTLTVTLCQTRVPTGQPDKVRFTLKAAQLRAGQPVERK